MPGKYQWQKLLDRRTFVKVNAQAGLALLLNRCVHMQENRPSETSFSGDFLKSYSPIDRSLGDKVPAIFSGDQNERPHRILWDLANYLPSKKVESEEETPLAVVGGGLSGLFTTYRFRKHQPILLEQAARFGGNAKGQSWRGLDYAIGSAYINLPPHGTPMHDWYQELHLDDIFITRKHSDPGEFKGKIYSEFWEGETEPKLKPYYHRMNQFFTELCAEKTRAFPFIPSLNEKHLASVRHFDQYDLHTLLKKVMGGNIPPHLEAGLEYFCWSTYAGSAKELSASAALNFLAQESSPVKVAPGGNARVAERILERLVKEVPPKNLRASSIVVQVKVETDHVSILYEDPQGKLRRIKAKTAVLCCPKFVAAKMVDGLEPERLHTIKNIRYRSYMTANLLLNKRASGQFYDLFMMREGKTDYKNLKAWQDRINATDFVLANYASENHKVSILTFYRAFPYDGARAELYAPGSYALYRRKFEKQIADEILPLVKLSSSDIVDLRLTLWGHALPLSAKGMYRDGTVEQLRKPFRDRVFFIEQDNWVYPSLQTGATEVALLRNQIEKVLGK